MLNDKNMTQLETLLGLEGGVLKGAIESEDSTEIEIPTGTIVDTENSTVFSKKELLKRDDRLKETHVQAGREMLVKEFKRDNNLEFDGKTLEHLRAFDKKNILEEAGKEPSEQIKALEVKNGKLVITAQDWETKHNNLVTSNTAAEGKRKTNDDILGYMKGDFTQPKSDMLILFNARHDISMDGDIRKIKRNGETLEDEKTFEPLSLKNVVGDFTKGYLKDVEGGAGGSNAGGSGGGASLKAFEDRMKTQGHDRGSEAYMRAENAAIADKTLVI